MISAYADMAENGLDSADEGVRVYRGRTLADLLPQIRQELGPDAIILREREGLVGGIGGFFAQRFVEVEARSGSPSIDLYDDDDDFSDLIARHSQPDDDVFTGHEELPELPALSPAPADEPPVRRLSTPREAPWSNIAAAKTLPVQRPGSEPQPEPEPAAERAAEPEPAPAPAEAAPGSALVDSDAFLSRLREAAAAWADEDVAAAPAVAATAEAHEAAAPIAAEPAPAPRRTAPKTGAARKPRTTKPKQPATKATPAKGATKPAATVRPPAAAAPAIPTPAARAIPTPAARAIPAPAAPAIPAPAAPAIPTPASRTIPTPPAPAIRARPTSLRNELPAQTAPRASAPSAPPPLARTTSAPAPASSVAAPPAPPRLLVATRPAAPVAPAPAKRGLSGVLARVFARRPAEPVAPVIPPPRSLDGAAAATISSDLTSRGAGQVFVSGVISAAAAHGSALAGGLREAAAAELVRRIVPAPALPPGGAAIAFVGAGGSGKSSCTASLAAAYRRSSTLAVSVVALDSADGGRELSERLEPLGIRVHAGSLESMRDVVQDGRAGGIVIVDTPATTPTDGVQMRSLADRLEPLGLDAVYVTLPATLGPQAARRALASFGALRPTAMAITHADETDQLGVAIEIAVSHRIPLAYLHAGTDLTRSISNADPATVARHLLP